MCIFHFKNVSLYDVSTFYTCNLREGSVLVLRKQDKIYIH